MAMTQITDHEDQAQARLPEQFKGKTRMIAMVRALASETQDIEDAGFPMFDLLNISTQIGAQLDGIGDILTTPRDGKSDVDYRVALLEAAASITASGTPEQVIERFITLASPLRGVDYVEAFPAGYCIGATVPTLSDVQSGAPAGQVVLLTTGGLGTDDAYVGGFAVANIETDAVADDLPTFTGATTSGYTITTDGSPTTPVWHAADDATGTRAWLIGPSFIRLALPSAKRYGKFRMRSSAGIDPPTPTQFVIEGSNDDSLWAPLTGTLAGPVAADTWQDYVIPVANRTAYSYYRITTPLGGTITISEIEFYEATASTEVRAIAAHTNNTVTLVGVLTNWVNGNVVFFYGMPVVGDIIDAMVGASPTGVFVGLIDLFALPNDDLFLLPTGDTLYVPYSSSGG